MKNTYTSIQAFLPSTPTKPSSGRTPSTRLFSATFQAYHVPYSTPMDMSFGRQRYVAPSIPSQAILMNINEGTRYPTNTKCTILFVNSRKRAENFSNPPGRDEQLGRATSDYY